MPFSRNVSPSFTKWKPNIVPISPYGGTCGNAARAGRAIVTTDISRDLNDPEKAESVAYFVPRFSEDVVAYARGNLAHGIYVEYDRNIIWLFTNHGFYALSGQQALKHQ